MSAADSPGDWLTGWPIPPVVHVTGLRLAQGDRLPAGFGIAWWEEAQDVAVCLPVPLNVLARLVRKAYHRLLVGAVGPSVIDRAREETAAQARRTIVTLTEQAYQRGIADGERRMLAFVELLDEIGRGPH